MSNFLRRLTFGLWYYFNPPWDTGISPPELLDFIKNHPPGKAIDIGCGTATNVITLVQAGWQVTGVDFVPRAIRMARRKARKAGIQAEFLIRDATNLKRINGPFDLALDIGCFHSLGDQKADYLSELVRVLAPGGHWLMYGFCKAALSSPAPRLGPTPSRGGRPVERSRPGSKGGTGPGFAEADLSLIPASMTLVWRQGGLEKGERPSAWFLYRKE